MQNAATQKSLEESGSGRTKGSDAKRMKKGGGLIDLLHK